MVTRPVRAIAAWRPGASPFDLGAAPIAVGALDTPWPALVCRMNPYIGPWLRQVAGKPRSAFEHPPHGFRMLSQFFARLVRREHPRLRSVPLPVRIRDAHGRAGRIRAGAEIDHPAYLACARPCGFSHLHGGSSPLARSDRARKHQPFTTSALRPGRSNAPRGGAGPKRRPWDARPRGPARRRYPSASASPTVTSSAPPSTSSRMALHASFTAFPTDRVEFVKIRSPHPSNTAILLSRLGDSEKAAFVPVHLDQEVRPAAAVRDAQPAAFFPFREILHDLDSLIVAAAGNARVAAARYAVRFTGGHEHPHDRRILRRRSDAGNAGRHDPQDDERYDGLHVVSHAAAEGRSARAGRPREPAPARLISRAADKTCQPTGFGRTVGQGRTSAGDQRQLFWPVVESAIDAPREREEGDREGAGGGRAALVTVPGDVRAPA